MNASMVRRLILKDWYLNRWIILGAIGAGVLALGLSVSGSKAAFILGVILVVMIVISVGAQLAMTTTVLERKEQTLAFVMSLPVSWQEYTAAKLLANLIFFLIPWVVLAAGSFAVVLLVPEVPRGFVPYVAIMSLETLMSTCLIVAVALMSESQGWATAAILTGSLALNGFGYWVAHMKGIAAGMWGTEVHWTPLASGLLAGEFAVIAAILGITFFVQSRKTDSL